MGVIPAGNHANNRQRGAARVRKRDGLGGTLGPEILIAESQGGRGKGSRTRRSRPEQADVLRAVAGGIDGDAAPASASSAGRKGNTDRAILARCECSRAGIGLGKIAARDDAVNRKRGGALIGEGDCLYGAGGAHCLGAEGKGVGREAHNWGSSRAVQRDLLRAIGGVIFDRNRIRIVAGGLRLEHNAECATGAGIHRGAQIVEYLICAPRRKLCNCQDSVAGIGERHDLRGGHGSGLGGAEV